MIGWGENKRGWDENKRGWGEGVASNLSGGPIVSTPTRREHPPLHCRCPRPTRAIIAIIVVIVVLVVSSSGGKGKG